MITAAVISGCDGGVDAQSRLDHLQINEPNDYRWCGWSGEVTSAAVQARCIPHLKTPRLVTLPAKPHRPFRRPA